MNIAPILGPDGDAYFTWGGHDAWDTGVMHGWRWSLEWIRLNKRTQGVLIVGPVQRNIGSTGRGAAVFPATTLTHIFGIDRNGKATGSFDMNAAVFVIEQNLRVMGREPNRFDGHSLMNVILAKGIEVYTMPAAPQMVRRKLADKPLWDVKARAKASGKVISERTI